MEKIPITKAGYGKVDQELKQLKSEVRPQIIAAIAEARAHGDLSENAEYHSAREKQSFIEGRILELEGIISRAEVIDTASLSGNKVMFGAHVTLLDENSDQQRKYQLVGEVESDVESGLLNISTPLARALVGKEVGDNIEVVTPGGVQNYEILAVHYE